MAKYVKNRKTGTTIFPKRIPKQNQIIFGYFSNRGLVNDIIKNSNDKITKKILKKL